MCNLKDGNENVIETIDCASNLKCSANQTAQFVINVPTVNINSTYYVTCLYTSNEFFNDTLNIDFDKLIKIDIVVGDLIHNNDSDMFSILFKNYD